jgi:hypothetical protein
VIPPQVAGIVITAYETENARRRLACETRLHGAALLNEDGYPTEDALWALEHWPFDDVRGWLGLAKRLWQYAELTWAVKEVSHDLRDGVSVKNISVSTFGWSGNESIVAAMELHHVLWSQHWVQSRRGGHYIFETDCSVEI